MKTITLALITLALIALAGAAFAEDAAPTPAPADAAAYIAQAKALLGKAKVTLPGAESEKLDRAMEALDLFLAKKPVKDDTAPEKLDPKQVKDIIGAKFTLKGAANDEITISYTQWGSPELSDYSATASPAIIKGSLAIEPGATMTNLIKFKDASIQGEVACGNKEGDHFGTTGGFSALSDNYNSWFIHMMVSGNKAGSAVYDHDYTETAGKGVWIPFSFKQSKGAATLTWKGQKLAAQVNGDVGSFTLSGGRGGNQFRGITISGTLDHEWVATAVQQKAIDNLAAKKPKK
jgi:hypothetical protein